MRLVDEILRDDRRFGVAEGLASQDVTLADPAMGTGTFLLGVLQRIAERVDTDQGEGAVPAAIRAALARIIGFEIQFGPFAVAQLRLAAEVVDLLKADTAHPEHVALRLFLTDTLGNPNEEFEYIPYGLSPLAERDAHMWQTVFPNMANWLPDDEAAQLRLEFAREMERLKGVAQRPGTRIA